MPTKIEWLTKLVKYPKTLYAAFYRLNIEGTDFVYLSQTLYKQLHELESKFKDFYLASQEKDTKVEPNCWVVPLVFSKLAKNKKSYWFSKNKKPLSLVGTLKSLLEILEDPEHQQAIVVCSFYSTIGTRIFSPVGFTANNTKQESIEEIISTSKLPVDSRVKHHAYYHVIQPFILELDLNKNIN